MYSQAMSREIPHFRIPLNLPHAATIATRIEYHVQPVVDDPVVLEQVQSLIEILAPFGISGENPPPEEATVAVEEAAKLARALVDAIERLGVGHDRLGQAVRNLFECLALGREGAILSLRAGENPDSALRPV